MNVGRTPASAAPLALGRGVTYGPAATRPA
jgi:hypothetical protein